MRGATMKARQRARHGCLGPTYSRPIIFGASADFAYQRLHHNRMPKQSLIHTANLRAETRGFIELAFANFGGVYSYRREATE
jgi:hypothetical protein